MQLALATSLAVITAFVGSAFAETHTVHFDNHCGYGTPTLVQNETVLSTGADYISNGPLITAIAYLQTGNCGFNGENCTVVETTLVNPTIIGPSVPSTYISLAPPYAFSVATGFGYYGGCDGVGGDCTSPTCPIANPNGPFPQVVCQTNNVNLVIIFCD